MKTTKEIHNIYEKVCDINKELLSKNKWFSEEEIRKAEEKIKERLTFKINGIEHYIEIDDIFDELLGLEK